MSKHAHTPTLWEQTQRALLDRDDAIVERDRLREQVKEMAAALEWALPYVERVRPAEIIRDALAKYREKA